jgi:hypothetical protein
MPWCDGGRTERVRPRPHCAPTRKHGAVPGREIIIFLKSANEIV